MSWAESQVLWGGNLESLLMLTKRLDCVFDEAQDDDLSFWLEAAGEAAERYCGTVLRQRDVTDNYAKSRSPVMLANKPATSLVSVNLDGEDVTDDWELFTDLSVQWATSSRSIVNSSCVFKQLAITYTAGYDPLPADLANVIARTAINGSNSSSGPVRKETIVGVGSIEYLVDDLSGSAFSASYTAILDKYRRMIV